MRKILPAFALVSLLIVETASAGVKLTSRQHEDLQALYNELAFCKARLQVVASNWIDAAWEIKERDGGWTKESRNMLKGADGALDYTYRIEEFQVPMREFLGLSETTIYSLSSKARDHANEVVPQPALSKHMLDYMETCNQASKIAGKAMKAIIEQD